MFVDIAKIKIKAGNGGDGAGNMSHPADPTAATAARAETSYSRSTIILPLLRTSAIRESTARPTESAATADAGAAKTARILSSKSRAER